MGLTHSAAADRRKKMDLVLRRKLLQQALRTDVAVDHHGESGSERIALAERLAESGKLRVERGDHFTDRTARHLQRFSAAGSRTQEARAAG
jgi:hypothetical protein